MGNNSIIKNNTIGLFNDSFPPIMDGVALSVQNSAYSLYKKNQPVCVITPKSPNYVINEPYPVYRYSSIPFISHQPYRIGIKEVDISFQNTIDKIPLSLVHAHCPFTSGQIALQIAKKRNIPFVATFHSKYRDDFERTFHNKSIAKYLTNKIVDFYNKADEVWIPQAMIEDTIREYGYKGKLYVIENGNDFAGTSEIAKLRIEAREMFQIAPNENVFLFVGQHIWEKNTKMIIEALAKIKDTPFKMYFIGTGYAADDMKQLVTDFEITDKVKFVGIVLDRELLKRYYAAADLFLFPSIYDNAPLVVREASALQTPAVLVKDSTASEVITDNFNGFLIENTASSLAEKIRELTANPLLICEAGTNASKTIGRTWEHVTELMLERYNNLMQ
ncbi:MAG: glycosyltransferase [Paludibacter sp.]|jgi:glycosyltransferase involved in cell wall biosynthesis|nr:glycosyltransferase [Paludibacter sp.]